MTQTIFDHATILPGNDPGARMLGRLDPHTVQLVVLPAAPHGVALTPARHQPTVTAASLTPDDFSLVTWEDAEWQ
jgi:hypothetical protein